MTKIIPAVLPESFEDLTEKVEKVYKLVDMIAIDITDGLFASSKTWPFEGKDVYAFDNLVKGDQFLPHAEDVSYEIDMMVRNPIEYIEDWLHIGADSFVIHMSSTMEEDMHDIISRVKARGKEIGIAIKPSEPINLLDPFIHVIDFVQCMGNDKIGYSGVTLHEGVYTKISTIHELYPHLEIAVDIGVNRDTGENLVEAGAEKLIANSAIFKANNIEEEIEFFKTL